MQLRIPLACLALVFVLSSAGAALAAKKSTKPLTTPDGRPIRTVYVHAFSAAVANAAKLQLQSDTCLTPTSEPRQADAVLEFSVALPAVGNDSLPTPNVFAPPVGPQTLESKNSTPQQNASFNCTSGKGGKQCSSSYDIPAGDVADLPSQSALAGGPAGVDIFLTTPGPASQQIWEQAARKKQTWTDQLRSAVGCPVCPGERFDRHRYKTYSNWMEQRCKSVMLMEKQTEASQTILAPSQNAKK